MDVKLIGCEVRLLPQLPQLLHLAVKRHTAAKP